MDGLGNINWWGFSPSIDFLKLINDNQKPDDNDEYINILIFNAGDQRHILESLASKRKCYPNKKIRFYVYEKMLELYARDFLLLSIALEHPTRTGLQEKTELFLEIFGNLLIREHTSKIIQSKANEFIKLITDLEALEKSSNLRLFDFSLLKYKERDYLEGIFKYWRLNDDSSKEVFPSQKCWDARLRAYFGTRYDSRSNAYDWDFTMKLIERKHAAIVNNRLYAKWRETGVGFELRDVGYDKPNRTLSSGMVFNDPRGDKTSRRGYFGDIIVGPFISYGIRTTNEDLYKKQNDAYRFTTTDVSKSNLSKLIESLLELGGIENTEKYDPLNEAKITEIKEETDNKPTEDYIKIDDSIMITFLPLTTIQDFLSKSKFDNFFHMAYFSNTGAVNMNKELTKILKPNALVLFETAKFMLEMRHEQINGFSDRLKQIAVEANLTDLNSTTTTNKSEDTSKIKLEENDYLIFKFPKS